MGLPPRNELEAELAAMDSPLMPSPLPKQDRAPVPEAQVSAAASALVDTNARKLDAVINIDLEGAELAPPPTPEQAAAHVVSQEDPLPTPAEAAVQAIASPIIPESSAPALPTSPTEPVRAPTPEVQAPEVIPALVNTDAQKLKADVDRLAAEGEAGMSLQDDKKLEAELAAMDKAITPEERIKFMQQELHEMREREAEEAAKGGKEGKVEPSAARKKLEAKIKQGVEQLREAKKKVAPLEAAVDPAPQAQAVVQDADATPSPTPEQAAVASPESVRPPAAEEAPVVDPALKPALPPKPVRAPAPQAQAAAPSPAPEEGAARAAAPEQVAVDSPIIPGSSTPVLPEALPNSLPKPDRAPEVAQETPIVDPAPQDRAVDPSFSSSSATAYVYEERESLERPGSLTQDELERLKLPLGNGAKLHDNAEVGGEQVISFGTQAEAQAFAEALFGGRKEAPISALEDSEAGRFGVAIDQITINKMQYVARGDEGWSARAAFTLSVASPAQPQEPAPQQQRRSPDGLSPVELVKLKLMPESQNVHVLPNRNEKGQVVSFKDDKEAQEFAKKVYGNDVDISNTVLVDATTKRSVVLLSDDEVRAMQAVARENKPWTPTPKAPVAAAQADIPPPKKDMNTLVPPPASAKEVRMQNPAAQEAPPAQRPPQPQRPPVQQQQYALLATTTPGVFVQVPVITPAEYRQNLNDQMDKFLATEKDRFFAMELAERPGIKSFDEIPEGKRKQFEIYEKGQVARKENLLQQNFLQEEMATAAPDRAGYLQQKLVELQQIQFERDKEYGASIERARKGSPPYDLPATEKMDDLQYKQNPLIFEGHIETVKGVIKRSELNQEMIGELQAMAGKNAQVQAKPGAVNARVVLNTPKEAQEILEKLAAVHDVKGRDQEGKKFYPNSDKPPKFVVYVTPGEVQKVKESMVSNSVAAGKGKGVAVARVAEPSIAEPVVARVAEAVVAPAVKQPDPVAPPPPQVEAPAPIRPQVEAPAPIPQVPTLLQQDQQALVQEQPQPWYKRLAEAVKNAFGASKGQEAEANLADRAPQKVAAHLPVNHHPQTEPKVAQIREEFVPLGVVPPQSNTPSPSPTPGKGQVAAKSGTAVQ